jgi:replicative DNA helicase
MKKQANRESALAMLEEPKQFGREVELFTPEQMVDEWAHAIEGDIDRPLTTCIEKIDKDLRSKLRGTVGAYIGYGGTKKSLLALQACRTNVLLHENKCTGIYSNMEMAIFQFMSRLIDMSFEIKDYNYNSSCHFETIYKDFYKANNKEMLLETRKRLQKLFADKYGNNLYINSQSSMRIEDYYKIVKKAKEKNEHVDMLVIDGLSMMAGMGSEMESYTTNSKELKDLAKLENIYIPLICHLSKGAEKHTRDVQRYIRGSEKILDNVDFVIQMSLLIDENRSGESINYLSDKGFIRFYNKRGSGNTIDTIYNFDRHTLHITETSEEPSNYEVKRKKSAFED